MSDEEEVQEIEESTSGDEEQDPCVLHGMDEESAVEREAKKLRRHRHAHRPPTVEEMREHLRTHLLYRSWCQHCGSGRGVSTQHQRRSYVDDSVEVATVAVDYCFLRNTPGEILIFVLIMRDRETRVPFRSCCSR